MSDYLVHLDVELHEAPNGTFEALCLKPPIIATAPTLELLLESVRSAARRLIESDEDLRAHFGAEAMPVEVNSHASLRRLSVPVLLSA